MMKIEYKLFLLPLLLALCHSCGVLSLMTCNYRIDNVSAPMLAGINVSNRNDLTHLDASTALKVTSTLFSGSLPLSATVNIGVSNPNATAAQIAGLEWILFFEDVQMVTGALQQQVYVAPNGGTSSIPLTIQADLVSLFKKESLEKMLQFANGLLHLGEKGVKVTLKIRPSIAVGGQVLQMGYITLNREI